MLDLPLTQVREALVAGRVTGRHTSHSRAKNIDKIHLMLAGDEDASFGLSDLSMHSASEVLGFMSKLVGCSSDIEDKACEDFIDPDLTLRGIVATGERLRAAAGTGARLFIATGHPTGMLMHHIKVADAYRRAGGKILHLREEEELPIGKKSRYYEVRYTGGVGCFADWGSLKHTHSPVAMEALLEEEPWPDLVFADHGFAGAAIQRGIPTIAVMDINDHALAVAAGEGRDVLIVPMDDNRPPRLYEPAWTLIERVLESTA